MNECGGILGDYCSDGMRILIDEDQISVAEQATVLRAILAHHEIRHRDQGYLPDWIYSWLAM